MDLFIFSPCNLIEIEIVSKVKKKIGNKNLLRFRNHSKNPRGFSNIFWLGVWYVVTCMHTYVYLQRVNIFYFCSVIETFLQHILWLDQIIWMFRLNSLFLYCWISSCFRQVLGIIQNKKMDVDITVPSITNAHKMNIKCLTYNGFVM